MTAQVEDKICPLSDGRKLAYAESGNPDSSTVVLFIPGAFSVADARHLPPVLKEKGVHYVTYTLQGWGQSSSVPNPWNYASTVIKDASTLLDHCHPRNLKKLIITAHSFGGISAQILYGASYDDFPQGRYIAGMILVAVHAPPHAYPEYTKCMSWAGYFLTGPPSLWIPFNLFARLMSTLIAPRVKTLDGASAFIHKTLFANMQDAERKDFANWRKYYGIAHGQYEREWGEAAYLSVAKTWQGFLDVPKIYQSGWGGFSPAKLEDKHAAPPVIIASGTSDITPAKMAPWLAQNYKHSTLKFLEGGHLAGLFVLDEFWKVLLD